MPRMLPIFLAGFLACCLASPFALAQVAGEDLDGPPPARQTQSQQPLFAQPPTQGHEHAQAQRGRSLPQAVRR